MRNETPSVSQQHPASRLEWLGERPVVLRPSGMEDAAAMAQAVDRSLPELKRFMAWAHYPNSEEGQALRLRTAHADYWAQRDACFTLLEKSSGRLLGGFGLHARTLNPRVVEIGYWMDSASAGRGYATLATQMLMVYALDYLRLDSFRCGYNEANVASRRVNEKCGFVIEGRRRYHESMGTPQMRAAGYAVTPITFDPTLFTVAL